MVVLFILDTFYLATWTLPATSKGAGLRFPKPCCLSFYNIKALELNVFGQVDVQGSGYQPFARSIHRDTPLPNLRTRWANAHTDGLTDRSRAEAARTNKKPNR